MKNTVVIAYPGGAYGTYLEWCLTSLCCKTVPKYPFTSAGNSHKFNGNHWLNINGWRAYTASGAQCQFGRLHPKVEITESINDNLNEVLRDATHLIHLYPDQNTILLCLNNFFYKIYNNWIEHFFKTRIDPNKIYENWPVAKDTPLDQIPQWIMREFLSFYLMPTWFDQVEWDFSQQQQHSNSMLVTVSELLFNFEHTLSKIEKFCNLNYIQPVKNLLEAHQTNLQLQKYIDHDKLCNQIIDSVVNKIDFVWPVLSLPSEAWVQWELRNRGLEIRCNGLDIFPTSSIQLRELLYPI